MAELAGTIVVVGPLGYPPIGATFLRMVRACPSREKFEPFRPLATDSKIKTILRHGSHYHHGYQQY
jgi:hypothetical protein